MSYVTEKQGANPAGLFGAIAINGAVVLAALTAATVIIPPKERGERTVVFDVPVEKPPEEKKKVAPIVEMPKHLPVFVEKPIVGTLVPPDGGISTRKDVVPAEAAGGIVGISDRVKEPIEKIIPMPIFKAASRDPKYARKFQPRYPVRLLSKNIEGKAVIKVLIGIDGRVRRASVVSATHEGFGKAALKQALKSWRFIAATRDGKPVEDWQTLTVRFDINE